MENRALDDEELEKVVGGAMPNDGGLAANSTVKVKSIPPYWIRVTASTLSCRDSPDGKIITAYNSGHRLQVNGITVDGKWYRILTDNPKGGTCDGYVIKWYTERA